MSEVGELNKVLDKAIETIADMQLVIVSLRGTCQDFADEVQRLRQELESYTNTTAEHEGGDSA